MNESEIRLKERIEGERYEEFSNFQSKNDNTMQLIIKKLCEQRLTWRPHGINSPTWAYFCVNDETLVDVKVSWSCVVCCVMIDK
jgi:hypothetical protein